MPELFFIRTTWTDGKFRYLETNAARWSTSSIDAGSFDDLERATIVALRQRTQNPIAFTHHKQQGRTR